MTLSSDDSPTVSCRTPVVDQGNAASCQPEVSVSVSRAEAAQSSARARCTAAVSRRLATGDDARQPTPHVTADTGVLSTAAAEASASDRCPYAAVSRAASQAASTAISHVILQVRGLTNGAMMSDAVELELTARCLVQCHRSVDATAAADDDDDDDESIKLMFAHSYSKNSHECANEDML